MDRGAWRLQPIESLRVRQDRATSMHSNKEGLWKAETGRKQGFSCQLGSCEGKGEVLEGNYKCHSTEDMDY